MGNSMHVGTVSAVIRNAFTVMEGVELCEDSEAMACTARRVDPVLTASRDKGPTPGTPNPGV